MATTAHSDTVGRTPWDAAVDVTRVLGNLAPLVVIAAGVLFAFYKFQQQSNQYQRELSEAQQKVQDQFMQDLTEARTALVTTYKDIGELSNQQISNIRTLLTLNDEVTQRLDSQRSSLDALQQEVEAQQKLAEAQLRAAEEARQAAIDAERRKRDAEIARADLAKQMADQRSELDRLTVEVQQKAAGLNERAASIESLRASLQELVDAVLQEHDPLMLASEGGVPSIEIARRVNADILVDPKALLAAFAAAPDKGNLAELGRLAGVTEDRLSELVEDELGYLAWYRVHSPEYGNEGYLGVVGQDDHSYRGLVYLLLGDGRVVQVVGSDHIVAVKLPDSVDWNANVGIVSVDDEGETQTIAAAATDTHWSLTEDVLSDADQVVTPVYGDTSEVAFLDLDSFVQAFPDRYARWLDDFADTPPRLNIEMLKRSQAFVASQLRGMEIAMPPALRGALTTVLDAAVNRQPERAADNLDDPTALRDGLGRLGAIALRDSFGIIGVQYPEPEKPTRALPPPPEQALQATVLGEYQVNSWGDTNRVSLAFGRADPSAPWRLIGWSEEEFVGPISTQTTITGTRG